MNRFEALPPPSALRADVPGVPVDQARADVAAVLDGRDDRLLVIVGPCSVHDPVAALDYAAHLARLAVAHRDDLLVVMRVYLEKPRSTVGWKGLLLDPAMDGSHDIATGLRAGRTILGDVAALGLPVACEFLDPLAPPYLADLVSWGCIGARTAESQTHRQLASGLPMPVGVKNTTAGDVQAAVDAVVAMSLSSTHLGLTPDGRVAAVTTGGNPHGHVVLRGSRSGPNYDRDSVEDVLERLRAAGLPERVVIDASHGNSGKDHRRQAVVVAELADRVAAGEPVTGVMVESFLVAGRQDEPIVHGQSVTDACVGIEQTAALLELLADAVAVRRADAHLTAGRRYHSVHSGR